MTEKTMNYTAEQTAEIVATYTAAPSVDTVNELAAKFGKTVRSIVAKLSAEKVYQAKAKKEGAKVVTKMDLIEKIANDLGVDKAKLESLEKATKEALQILANAA